MDNKTISSWVRQARYRAGKRDIYSELTIDEVQTIIDNFDGGCAYCGEVADTLDHPFPIQESTPNVAANVVPACRDCKSTKKTNDIVWLYTQGELEQERYLRILSLMFACNGGDLIKRHIKLITGIQDNDC